MAKENKRPFKTLVYTELGQIHTKRVRTFSCDWRECPKNNTI